MGFHHVALATHDTAATHRFYTEVMGFELVKVVACRDPETRVTASASTSSTTGPADDGRPIR